MRRLWLALCLLTGLGLARPTFAIDAFTNSRAVTVSIGYNAAATTIVLLAGEGAAAGLPTTAANYSWWNASDYGSPDLDPSWEIIRCTRATDTLTCTRAVEAANGVMTAVAHNTAGKVYKLLVTLTAKTLNTDIATTFLPLTGGTVTGPVTVDTTANNAVRRQMTTPPAPSLVTDQSGVNLAAGDYKVAIVGVDPLGGTSLPSPIVTQTVGAGGTGEILVTFTTSGADHVLVYVSPVNGSTPDRYFPCYSITNGVTLTNCNIRTLAGATLAALPVTNTAYETSLGSSPSWVYGMTFWGDTAANAAFGRLVFGSSVTGVGNVAVGWNSQPALSTGSFNTSVGVDALLHNTIGNGNTGMGNDNSFQLTTGGNNTSYGMDALYNNTINHKNTAVGVAALYNVNASFNTAIGYNALYTSTAGASNVALGYSAGYYETGSNKLFIDNVTRANESDGRAKALLYGIFDAAVANQSLTLNGDFLVPGSSIRVGATPALTGPLRVANNAGGLRARNAANSGDITLVDINGSNGVVVGSGATTIGMATGNTGFGIETTSGVSWYLNSSGHLFAVTDNVSDIGAAAATRPRTGYFGTSVVAPTFQINGVQGSVGSAQKIRKSVTAIADATLTTVLTITIPNAAHSAMVAITVVGSLGAGGAIGANEASATNSYNVVVNRTAGVNAVATVSSAFGAAASNVAGAATVTATVTAAAVSGAVGASNTIALQVTITKSGGSSTNHTCQVLAEIVNANATGVTIS